MGRDTYRDYDAGYLAASAGIWGVSPRSPVYDQTLVAHATCGQLPSHLHHLNHDTSPTRANDFR